MRVKLAGSIDALTALSGEWQELADAAGGRSATHPFWCLPWLDKLGRGSPLLAVAYEGDVLAAVVPLQERRISGLRTARFIGHELGGIGEMLVAPGHEAVASELWAHLLHDRRRHLELGQYRAHGSTLETLKSVSPATVIEPSDTCPTLAVPGSLEEYLAGRPKGLRRTLRRADTLLHEKGRRHTVEVVATPDRAGEVLAEVVAICDLAERHRQRQHLLAGRWKPFTVELIRTASVAGRLRLFVGRIDGTPVSFDLGLVTGNRIELWLGRYAPEWAAFSPGHLSMRAVVAHAVDAGAGELDMGLGDDRYKRLWCPDGYDTVSVVSGSTAGAVWLARQLIRVRRRAWTWAAVVKKRLIIRTIV